MFALALQNYKVIYYLLSEDLPLFMSVDYYFLFAEVKNKKGKKKEKVVPWSLNYMSNSMCFCPFSFLKYDVK